MFFFARAEIPFRTNSQSKPQKEIPQQRRSVRFVCICGWIAAPFLSQVHPANGTCSHKGYLKRNHFSTAMVIWGSFQEIPICRRQFISSIARRNFRSSRIPLYQLHITKPLASNEPPAVVIRAVADKHKPREDAGHVLTLFVDLPTSDQRNVNCSGNEKKRNNPLGICWCCCILASKTKSKYANGKNQTM